MATGTACWSPTAVDSTASGLAVSPTSRRSAHRLPPSASTTSSSEPAMISAPMAMTSGSRAGVRALAYKKTGYVGCPDGARNEAIANSSKLVTKQMMPLDTSAGASSGSVISRSAANEEAPRSSAASFMAGSSERSRGMMTRIANGSTITQCPSTTAMSDGPEPSTSTRISSPTARQMYGTTSGSNSTVSAMDRARPRSAMSPRDATMPSAVAIAAATSAMNTLRTSAPVSSALLNAWWNHSVEKPDRGSVGVGLEFTEKMSRTTRGANRNRTKAQK